MTAWDEYVAAAQALDEERRAAAATLAEQSATLRMAREELATVRQRLALQRNRITDVGARNGLRVPALHPTDADVNAALAPGGGPAAALAALHEARSTLDNADADLTTVDGRGAGYGRLATSPPAIRNLVVYGSFALIVLIVQVALFVVASERTLPALAPVCGLVLPALAFTLGWLTVGLVYPPAAGAKVDRTPLVGALVCLVAPVLITCAGFGAFALMR